VLILVALRQRRRMGRPVSVRLDGPRPDSGLAAGTLSGADYALPPPCCRASPAASSAGVSSGYPMATNQSWRLSFALRR